MLIETLKTKETTVYHASVHPLNWARSLQRLGRPIDCLEFVLRVSFGASSCLLGTEICKNQAITSLSLVKNVNPEMYHAIINFWYVYLFANSFVDESSFYHSRYPNFM